MIKEDKEWENGCGLFPQECIKEQQKQEREIFATTTSTIHPTPAMPPLHNGTSTTLNGDNGYARTTLECLVGHESLEKARATNNTNWKTGQSVQDMYLLLEKILGQ